MVLSQLNSANSDSGPALEQWTLSRKWWAQKALQNFDGRNTPGRWPADTFPEIISHDIYWSSMWASLITLLIKKKNRFVAVFNDDTVYTKSISVRVVARRNTIVKLIKHDVKWTNMYISPPELGEPVFCYFLYFLPIVYFLSYYLGKTHEDNGPH